MSDAQRTLLVADIGGTNARFALATHQQGQVQLQGVQTLQAADFATLADAVRHYLRLMDHAVPAVAVFAVAAPVTSDAIRITNNPWQFSVSALRQELGLAQLQLINDFAAVAYAVPQLQTGDLVALGAVPSVLASKAANGRYAVLGPGTGLGLAHLLRRAGETIVIETEGGHVGFAPSTAEERQIHELLLREFPRVSWERLLCGPGLVNLYRALCTLHGQPAVMTTPADITEQAALGSEPMTQRTVEMFCALLGSFAGDVVLGSGAWDGVYLAGGITPRLLPWLRGEGFRKSFEAKGRFSGLMQKVPTLVITHPQVGLLGAAAGFDG